MSRVQGQKCFSIYVAIVKVIISMKNIFSKNIKRVVRFTVLEKIFYIEY